MESTNAFRSPPRLFFGLFVIAVGVLLTLDNLRIVHIRHLWDYWPVVLIVIGLGKLAQSRGAGRGVGLGFVVVGTLLLLDRLDYIRFDLWDLWPLALIVVGASMLWGGLSRRAARDGATGSTSTVHAFAFFSSVQRSTVSADFRGGDVTAVLGSCEIDLTRASVSSGEAVLDAHTFMGSIEIRVPADWNVVLHGTPFLGSFENNTTPSATNTKTLVVHGLSVMASVEVRN